MVTATPAMTPEKKPETHLAKIHKLEEGAIHAAHAAFHHQREVQHLRDLLDTDHDLLKEIGAFDPPL